MYFVQPTFIALHWIERRYKITGFPRFRNHPASAALGKAQLNSTGLHEIIDEDIALAPPEGVELVLGVRPHLSEHLIGDSFPDVRALSQQARTFHPECVGFVVVRVNLGLVRWVRRIVVLVCVACCAGRHRVWRREGLRLIPRGS